MIRIEPFEWCINCVSPPYLPFAPSPMCAAAPASICILAARWCMWAFFWCRLGIVGGCTGAQGVGPPLGPPLGPSPAI